ncbi:MAG: AraC family transcriptional regulator [Lachnospiraceae bacterium]|nr:AraC family transcriptional regulator [Lachnospiraceae bacterium]
MQVDLLNTMISLFQTYGVQTILLTPPYANMAEVDYGFRQQISGQYSYEHLIHHIESNVQPYIVFDFEDLGCLHYTIFAFPKELQADYPYHYCIIGPVVFQEVTISVFQEFIQKYQVPPELHQDVQEFFNRIPLISSIYVWRSTLHYFIAELLGKQTKFLMADTAAAGTFLPNYRDYPIRQLPSVSISALEARYQAEADLMNAVTLGNTDEALAIHMKWSQFKIAPRNADPIRNMKNLLFVQNTLLRKAAQAGYVHPLHIDHISTQLAIQIENSTSMHQLQILSTTMIRKYCLLVKNYSRQSYTYIVQNCLDYIDFHYQEDLSLDSMAQMHSVTNSYLSALFKKEVGMTITNYINTTRIRQALILLNTTHNSIQSIALHCGFPDANYFTRVFKKYQGMTPKEYRIKIHVN